jgi:acyl carrier protein
MSFVGAWCIFSFKIVNFRGGYIPVYDSIKGAFMDPSYQQDPIFAKTVAVICEVLKVKPEKVTPESRIKEDLGADSLDTVSLLMTLEDEFKEPISDDTARPS